MNGNRFLLLIILLAAGLHLKAQNKFIPPDPYTQWDGVTHWSRYQVSSPGFLGPNGLPVPLVHKGYVPSKFYWSGMYEYYAGTGDETHDVGTHLVVPVASGRIGLEFRYVPIEFYRMDSLTSRLRRTRTGQAAEGRAFGDVYFGTMVQLLRGHRFLPDIQFAMSCRTASGTGRQDSRNTDSPGYYLDLSVGDSYGKSDGFFRSVRWYAEAGFYVWQTYLDNYPQNDAFLYGAGIDLEFRDFFLEQSLRGFSGYMHNGDQPVVYRADLGIRIGEAAMVFGYERGLRDYPFECLRGGFRISGLSGKQ